MTRGCVMILTKSHFGKFTVTETKNAQFVSGRYISYGETLEVLTVQKDCL